MADYYNPWDLAYTKLSEWYTQEQIDDMTWCEIQELLDSEE